MSLKITIVGCGDAFGSGGRRNTCFHLDAGDARYFVDFGASSMVGVNALGIDTDAVDAVILSHLHGDHFGGIPFLILHAHFVTEFQQGAGFLPATEMRERHFPVFFAKAEALQGAADAHVIFVATGVFEGDLQGAIFFEQGFTIITGSHLGFHLVQPFLLMLQMLENAEHLCVALEMPLRRRRARG